MGLLDYIFSQPAPTEEDPLAIAERHLREPEPEEPSWYQQLLASPAPVAADRAGVPTRQGVIERYMGGEATARQGLVAGAEAGITKSQFLRGQEIAGLREEQRTDEILSAQREQIHKVAGERIRRVNAEIDALAQEKPDPRGYFEDQGTFGNILSLIGVALGGYSAAKTGKNVPLEMIQREIDRHVEAQARGYEQKLAALQERRGAAKEELGMELNAFEYQVARRVDANNRIKRMATAMAGRFDDDASRAQLAQIIGERDKDTAKALEGLRTTAVSEANDATRIELQRKGLALEGARLAESKRQFNLSHEEGKRQFQVRTLMEMEQAERSGNVERAKHIKEEFERAVFVDDPGNPGNPVLAPRKEVAEALNKQRAAGDYIYTKIDEALRVMGDNDFALAPLDEKKRRVKAVIGDLENGWSALNEQGVITAADAARYAKLFGEPNGIIDNVEQLRQVRGLVVDKVNANLRERTGNQAATWRPDADPEYSTTVRPPGFKPRSAAPLPAPAAAALNRPGHVEPTREQYQQRQAYELEQLRGPLREPAVVPSGVGDAIQPPRYEDEDPLLSSARSLYGR
jgi:hypothetical protein